MFWIEIRYFSDVWVEGPYFSKSLGQNQILSECFRDESHSFQMFCAQMQYFLNTFRKNSIYFKCSGQKQILYECFRAKITLSSNVWFTNIMFFKPFDYNYDNFPIL